MPNFQQNEQFNVKEIMKLLDYVSPGRKKEIIFHWFTKCYGRKLGTARITDDWPFEESQEEFMKKYDAVFYVNNVRGGILMGWTSDTGKYRDYEESHAGLCNRCGVCCRNIALRFGGEPIRSEKQFKELCEKDPTYDRFSVRKHEETGNCMKNPDGGLIFECDRLGKDNLCKDYRNRLPMCSLYPYGKRSHELPDICGYKKRWKEYEDAKREESILRTERRSERDSNSDKVFAVRKERRNPSRTEDGDAGVS